MTQSPSRWRRWLPLVLLGCGSLAGIVFLRDYLSFEALREHRATLEAFRLSNPIAMPLMFMVAYALIVAFSLPGAAIATLTGGFLFGFFPGFVFNALGAVTGAVAIFWVVRNGLGQSLRTRIDASDGAVKKLSDGMRANEVSVLITMRLIPVVPFFVGNLIPAFLGVSTWRFAWTTLVGILPVGMIYTWIGAGLSEVFARGEAPDLSILAEPYVIGPLLGLIAFALLPVALKQFRRS